MTGKTQSTHLAILLTVVLLSAPDAVWAQSAARLDAAVLDAAVSNAAVAGPAQCVGGAAAGFACGSVDLVSHMSLTELGAPRGERLNDIWGWTDPQTGVEYALVGRTDATSFVDLSDPANPVLVGSLPHSGSRSNHWRDIKVYRDHAYIVADGAGSHGLQIFDLAQLRSVGSRPAAFEMTGHYADFGSAHNIAINEETGFGYIVGASGAQGCAGGLHMVDLADPAAPTFAGCFADAGTGRSGTGYTHDVQCVVYHGPDATYTGREICFGANETALSIADVTDKNQVVGVGRSSYPDVAYAHQGWLTEDHRYFLLGDELDEDRFKTSVRTLVWDVAQLDDPVLAAVYEPGAVTIDHNMYVRGSFVYQANYASGLRIADVSNPLAPQEVAFFDTTPALDGRSFVGTWSVYPYFDSGLVIVSSISEGLFVLRPTMPGFSVASETPPELPSTLEVDAPHPNPFSDQTRVRFSTSVGGNVRVSVTDVLGRVRDVLFDGEVPAGLALEAALDGSDLPAGVYVIRVETDGSSRSHLVTRIQ